MKVFKEGGHRLFETDPDTAKIVSEMLLDLEKNGMDAVRKYSIKFDDWAPESFELNERQINRSISKLEPQVIEDTDYCQGNVRAFAKAQLETMLPLEAEFQEGVILGHKHIPVNRQLHSRRTLSDVRFRSDEYNPRKSRRSEKGSCLYSAC